MFDEETGAEETLDEETDVGKTGGGAVVGEGSGKAVGAQVRLGDGTGFDGTLGELFDEAGFTGVPVGVAAREVAAGDAGVVGSGVEGNDDDATDEGARDNDERLGDADTDGAVDCDSNVIGLLVGLPVMSSREVPQPVMSSTTALTTRRQAGHGWMAAAGQPRILFADVPLRTC